MRAVSLGRWLSPWQRWEEKLSYSEAPFPGKMVCISPRCDFRNVHSCDSPNYCRKVSEGVSFFRVYNQEAGLGCKLAGASPRGPLRTYSTVIRPSCPLFP